MNSLLQTLRVEKYIPLRQNEGRNNQEGYRRGVWSGIDEGLQAAETALRGWPCISEIHGQQNLLSRLVTSQHRLEPTMNPV